MNRIGNIADVSNTQISSSVELSWADQQIQLERFLKNVLAEYSQTKHDLQNIGLDDFFAKIGAIIKAAENIDNSQIKNKDRLLYVEDDPEEAIDREAITFYLKAKVPGGFERGPAGVKNIKQLKPMVRSFQDHPDNPGEKLITYGKFYDNWVSFNIYARTAKKARWLMEWFLRVMDIYDWFLRKSGYRVILEGVGERELFKYEGITVIRYPISYFLRLDETFFTTSQEVKKFIIDINE